MAANGNFGVNNTLIRPVGGTVVTSNGNTTITSTGGSWGAPLTMAATTGKWYIEYYVNSGSSGRNVMVVPTNSLKYNQGNYNFGTAGDYVILLNSNGSIYNNHDSTATQSGLTALQTGDIMAMALNLDASPKTLQYYRNGTSIGTAENINASATGHFTFMIMGHNQSTLTVNAGQDSSFAGAKSTGTASAADDNGFGDFYYTPPSGFLAMCSGNLPVDSNVDPAQTNDDHPVKLCNAVAYTGTGTARNVTGFGFKPDFVWIKNRASPGDQANRLVDSSRGVSKAMISEDTQQENTETTAIQSFLDDGFSIGTALGGYNTNTGTYIAWGWKANGGTTSTNTSGTVTTTVQASTAGGFSILTYTGGNGSWGSTHRDTIGHGLSAAPEFMLFKERNNTDMWTVFHHEVGAGGGTTAAHNNLRLDNTEALYTNQSYKSFGGVMPTSTVITVEGNTTNSSTSNHIAYIWHGVEGYSKFGKFDGNNNNDGVHVYTGFRPRIIFIKSIDQAGEWVVYDTARNIDNPVDSVLNWDNSIAESANDSTRAIDVLSNGFKLRTSNITINNTNTYVFGAWGDVPFKYNNVHAQS